jgi:biotin carboxyl carrier protein
MDKRDLEQYLGECIQLLDAHDLTCIEMKEGARRVMLERRPFRSPSVPLADWAPDVAAGFAPGVSPGASFCVPSSVPAGIPLGIPVAVPLGAGAPAPLGVDADEATGADGAFDVGAAARSDVSLGGQVGERLDARTSPHVDDFPGACDGQKHCGDSSESCAVTAPLVGIVHRAPEAGAATFVEKGQHVCAGDVLCVIMAMELRNEVCAPVDGAVADIHVDDGVLVEFGALLFTIQRAS